MEIIDKLKSLNIILPEGPAPVGAYVAHKTIGKLIFISGQLPIKADGKIIIGKVGKDLTLEQGQKAAYYCCINLLAQLNSACQKDLNKVKNCVKISGFVNSTNDFKDQAKVLNSASELLVKIFGDAGKHARAAVSVNSLPLGSSVEIESVFEII
ncbi:RidA family protein [Pelagibacteraceae bacterium]|nr:RidA family protein [Pelagibacteraceae bacterium]